MTMHRILAAAALALASGAAFAAPPVQEADTTLGVVLADAHGMTLYTFDKDADGMSACYDKCAINWPPFLAEAGATAEGKFGLTERTDGAMQWTYDDQPLYLWIKDMQPGEVTGDGVGDVWHVIKTAD